MKTCSAIAVARVAVVVFWAHAATAVAADVKVLSAFGMRPVLDVLVPQFERANGHKVAVQYDSGPGMKRQIESGATFDLVIAPPPVIDDLTKQGKVAGATRAVIARSGIAVAVRAGAPGRDISSVDAFKRALLGAKSIAYALDGATAAHLAKVFARLDLTEAMKAKTKPQKTAEGTIQAVAAGEAEFGFAATSVILMTPGTAVLGVFPAELQDYVVYTAIVSAAAKESEAAKSLINFLRTEGAASVTKAKGLEPLGR